MFIWQYINPPIDEVLSMQEAYRNALPDNSYFFQLANIPKNKTFMGMDIYQAVLIQVAANSSVKIHRDFRLGDCFPHLAIQIPLTNCEGSITSFWESSAPRPKRLSTPNGHSYEHYEESTCTKLSEFKLTSPVLFDTHILHSVDNPTNEVRQAISLRFITDPWHLVTDSTALPK